MGLREEEVAVESSRTMRWRTAGIFEGVKGESCRVGFGKERRCRSLWGDFLEDLSFLAELSQAQESIGTH